MPCATGIARVVTKPVPSWERKVRSGAGHVECTRSFQFSTSMYGTIEIILASTSVRLVPLSLIFHILIIGYIRHGGVIAKSDIYVHPRSTAAKYTTNELKEKAQK